MMYQSVNPTTGERFAEFPLAAETEIAKALEQAVRAFGAWRSESFSRRANVLLKAAQLLEEGSGGFARTMALEMGKPLAEGEAEVKKCALTCRFFAEQAEGFLAPQPCPTDASDSHLRFEPLGPLLAIMPWNFPFWQVFRFAAPSLMAGNTVLLKHAPNTPQCALAIERLMREAGAPDGVFQSLFLSNEQAAEVMSDARVRGVSLTGSTRAGREVAQAAGRALKPLVLELGGSDPFIVFEDAPLKDALETAVVARCLNSGQSCIAAKRFLIQRGIEREFTERFVEAMGARRIGDPLDRETQVGPLARLDLRETLDRQVRESVAAGARVLCGGSPPKRTGFFYPPTVLAGAPRNSPAWTEELFGPVAVLIPFDTEDEAVEIANATPYGLGASLWTSSPERAVALIPRIEAGAVFINGMVKSDPRICFGGIKDSGFGRELGREGIREFVNVKLVWIR